MLRLKKKELTQYTRPNPQMWTELIWLLKKRTGTHISKFYFEIEDIPNVKWKMWRRNSPFFFIKTKFFWWSFNLCDNIRLMESKVLKFCGAFTSCSWIEFQLLHSGPLTKITMSLFKYHFFLYNGVTLNIAMLLNVVCTVVPRFWHASIVAYTRMLHTPWRNGRRAADCTKADAWSFKNVKQNIISNLNR